MSALIKKLEAAGLERKGTELGGLLQWAMTHIQSLEDALRDEREFLESLAKDYEALKKAVAESIPIAQALTTALNAIPQPIEIARDFAPHINIMAYHRVMPYAKNPRKPRGGA